VSILQDAAEIHSRLKQEHPAEIVLVKAGRNYVSFGSDAYCVPDRLHSGVGLTPVTGFAFVVVAGGDVQGLPSEGFLVWEGEES